MVVFTCQNCGESVNKPKVEKHYSTICKNKTYNLSCVDCFKDFTIDNFKSHTQCVTEDERYAPKGFVAKEAKGLKKQNTWVELIQSVLDEQKNAPVKVIQIIETVCKFNNTPRKKPKFFNFVKNVCGPKTNPKDIEQAWNLISVKLSNISGNTATKKEKDVTDDKENLENDTAENSNKEKNHILESECKKTENEPEKNDAERNEKMSKKQKKEEKKRKKYEAELQNAAVETHAAIEEEEQGKKEKKKKNRNNSTAEKVENETVIDVKTKNKKRKRQDTIVAAPDTTLSADITENIKKETVKAQDDKKKKKTKEGDINEDENVACLHDENVAKAEVCDQSDKFNWHSIIISILQKKDNEMPFKRLQKKVFTEYSQFTGREVDDRIAEKFIKKLKSAPNVKVDKNRVFLV